MAGREKMRAFVRSSMSLTTLCIGIACNKVDSRQAVATETPVVLQIDSPSAIVEYQRFNVQVETATSIVVSGLRCRLLGVNDSTDPSVRDAAEKFARMWFACTGNRISAANGYNAPRRDDGTYMVWIYTPVDSSELGTELVRNGLAEVDRESHQDYSFNTWFKGQPRPFDWRAVLDKAVRSRHFVGPHQRG